MFYNSQVKSPMVVSFENRGWDRCHTLTSITEVNYKFYINSERLGNKLLTHK